MLSAAPLPPAAPVISDITSTSCRLKYDEPEVQLNGPPVTGYFLEVRTTNGPWMRVNNIPVDRTKTEVRVTRLHCGTRYQFRLAAMNENRLGKYSKASASVVPLTKNKSSQPGPPVATVSATSVNLEWSMSDGDSETIHLRYVIRCRESNTERTLWYAITELKAGATIRHTLKNVLLKSETRYEFAVAVCTTTGFGPFSSYSNCVKCPPG